MVANLFAFVVEVVGVYAYAVSSDESGVEREEVPFRRGCLNHVARLDAHAVENERQLVHQRDVDVALSVLNDFCSLGNLDA